MRYFLQSLLLISLLMGISVFAQEDSTFNLPITEDIEYTVVPADTLDGIGALFDVSPSCIADTNNITDPSTVRIGDTLLITVDCPLYGEDPRDNVFQEVLIAREVVTYEDDCEGYRVRRNDSIDTIGFDLDVAPLSIAVANDLTPPYVLTVNQCLTIPDGAPPYDTTPALTNVNGDPVSMDDIGTGGGTGTYVIQRGDVLDLVAQELDISLQALLIFNNIEDATALTAGTVIYIPSDAPPYGVFPAVGVNLTGELYVIQEDDTLESIAQSFNVAQVAIEAVNEIDSDDELVAGNTLTIPANVPAFGEDDDFNIDMILGAGGGALVHVVQPRETIDGIAAFYDVDVQCLLETNDITYARLIQPGTALLIDINCPEYAGEGIPLIADTLDATDDATSDLDGTDTEDEED